MKFLTLASMMVAFAAVRADNPAPNRFWGSWTGTHAQAFALADPNNPGSYECLPQNTAATRPMTLSINSGTLTRSALPAASLQAGPAQYRVPAVAGSTWNWADYTTNNILMIRNATNNVIQCFYAAMSGSGDSRQLTVITLGGAPVVRDWTLQCNPANYERLPNYLTKPYCSSPGGNDKSAYNSTTLIKVNYAGGGSTDASSGTSMMSALLAAFGTVAAGAAVGLA